MNLTSIDENTEYVAIPIETPLVKNTPQTDNVVFDIEDDDRLAGLKHGGLCLLMLAILGVAIYIYWKECVATK